MDPRILFTYAVITIGFLIMVRYRAQLKRDMDVLNPRTWPVSYKSHSTTYWKVWFVATLVLIVFAFYLIQGAALQTQKVGIPLMDQSEDVVVQVTESDQSLYVALLVVAMIPMAVLEEWIFRHMLFRHIWHRTRHWRITPLKSIEEPTAQAMLNLSIAIVVSSLLFALIHLANNGALPGVLIPHFAAGILFSAVYMVGGFSMAISVHLGHNLLLIFLLLIR